MARYWAQAILLGVTVAVTTAAPAGAQTYKLADHHAYSREIAEAAARHAVPERLVWAVIRAESGFDPRAVSRQGARGLMQLMPETAAMLGVRDAFNPREHRRGRPPSARPHRALQERSASRDRGLQRRRAGGGGVRRRPAVSRDAGVRDAGAPLLRGADRAGRAAVGRLSDHPARRHRRLHEH